MKVTTLDLEGVLLLEPSVYSDHRGFFMESFNQENLYRVGIETIFVQDNYSKSIYPGIIRGLHFQIEPYEQAKLIQVCSGAIYDVIVDINLESPTFGQWTGVILSEHNKRQLFVPRGFAHGFCTLVPNTSVFYKIDNKYSFKHERGIIWNDPELSINWPESHPLLSEKDTRWPSFRETKETLKRS